MLHRIVSLSLTAFALLPAIAADSPSFRGPARNGVFPSTGLMKSWPEGGPAEKWAFEGLGQGYSSVTVVGDTIYTTGKTDAEGFLYAIGRDGKLKWKASYGPEGEGSGFPGARSTPEYDHGVLYLTSSEGHLLAFDATNGTKLWDVDLLKTYGGENPRFGISESVLIDGNNLICTPGGTDSAVIALDKKNGQLVWRTTGLSDKASYCSARIFDNGTVRQIINLTATSMVGIDPKNGSVLWRQDYPVTYGIHAVSPVFHNNYIYVADGYNQGGIGFELAADGKSVRELWREKSLDVHHGGLVEVGGYAYGASSTGTWGCVDMKTGEVVARHKELGKGSVIYADGLLYGYDEKGMVGLMDPSRDKFRVISSFKVERGAAQHWSHPVIVDHELFIRHGDVLMCYDIGAKP